MGKKIMFTISILLVLLKLLNFNREKPHGQNIINFTIISMIIIIIIILLCVVLLLGSYVPDQWTLDFKYIYAEKT